MNLIDFLILDLDSLEDENSTLAANLGQLGSSITDRGCSWPIRPRTIGMAEEIAELVRS
jgi:hypothetical protein